MDETLIPIEDVFFAYAKDRTLFPPRMLMKYLKMAADYCHLKEPLLGITNVKAVHRVQQKVAAGKLLRFRFGKDAQNIRTATQLYYSFIKSCQEVKDPRFIQDNVPPEELISATANADLTLNIPTELLVEAQGAATTENEVNPANPIDDRWLPILQDSFSDGYILDDFLSQFQAGAYWLERYGDACPIEGALIDQAMMSVGSVQDGRVFAKNGESSQLIFCICKQINEILSQYTNVYRSCIYERYREQLSACSIYTESVMTQHLLDVAGDSFYSTYQVFARPGQENTVIQDCRKVLRSHGGAMNVRDLANEMWFIPYDLVYHSLSTDSEALNIGTGVWMLAEYFPLTAEDAAVVGNMLDKCFQSRDFVQQADLMPLLQKYLPSIADNLSALHSIAVFNILKYYLKDSFSFSKAIIAPKGAKMDFRDLFQDFAKKHIRFTLDELSAFATELQIPIYWENTFLGGAVRISETEFVNQKLISFDVDSTDKTLESLCPGDYLPLQDISSAMMMHLPPCGYRWNGYLLLSYVYGFSKTFRLVYNSLGKTGYYGAMVRRSCKEIDCYGRLVERILTDDDTWTTESEALNMLVQKGLQAQRRLRGIDRRIAQARQNKLSDRG